MENELEVRTKSFALNNISLASSFYRNKVSDVVGYQLLKRGTSIGANYRKANRTQTGATKSNQSAFHLAFRIPISKIPISFPTFPCFTP